MDLDKLLQHLDTFMSNEGDDPYSTAGSNLSLSLTNTLQEVKVKQYLTVGGYQPSSDFFSKLCSSSSSSSGGGSGRSGSQQEGYSDEVYGLLTRTLERQADPELHKVSSSSSTCSGGTSSGGGGGSSSSSSSSSSVT